MAEVSVRDLRKSFGAVSVLHGLEADIADGEFIAVLGESGCGKSTFLRIIAGLEDATSGAIMIDGHDVTTLSPKERDIAMVFQSYALYPHMSVRQNMDFPLEVLGLDKDARSRRIDETASLLNLEQYLDRKPRDLSGGQRQRVAMARAIVREPKVFLFDEPLSNLDAKLRVQMRGEIRSLQQKLKVTAIYVTHDQVEALTMADRVMLLNNGKIEQFATPLELYDRPASVYVAGFVGAPPMNLVPGSIDEEGTVDAIGTHFRGPRGAGGKVIFGFRPEHLRVVDGADAQFHGQVLSSENTGDRLNVVLEVAGQTLNLSMVERLPLKVGSSVPLTVLPDFQHLFDEATGLRI
ncbi:sn-glycerol-3-phosphate ABC transporter ATP-binding protein UgpC [Devosia algicola]|uniref:Sn-glycerol-3-phosphate ABC transporter ATP-binding protein UgpC n=1 Tax=Devosia algicola TaxID=3026418 RepID=A0ABY7YR30_9HYPH|nr:sn-glycerol-3-phosphate ABC transporter ATP-binding protein UgpC [Devosia algicola]WDR03474.1 sn-glycerol-3-phosphate ABC transporter ATP-binding protein UgpC [Devosia algicola]